MRVKNPEVPRQFKAPAYKLTATIGIIVCAAMIFGLGWTNWARLIGWLIIGLFIYFSYSIKNSRLRKGKVVDPKDPVDVLNPK
jgi:APA family basic amino acid/polyamine antiporter